MSHNVSCSLYYLNIGLAEKERFIILNFKILTF